MKTYLIEAYSDEIEFDKDSIVIALTPEVCYQLDKKSIKYSIIEDYYDAVALSGQAEEHRQAVFRWIEDFDEFLRQNVTGQDLKLATIYRWYLKGRIIDPIYLRCYMLQHLFQALKPTEVAYFAPKPTGLHPDFKFDNYGQSLYSLIIPIICRENKIILKTTLLELGKKKAADSKQADLISRFKATLYNNRAIRKFYFFFRCLKNLPQLKRAGANRRTIFLVSISYIGEDFVAEALVRGHQIYRLSGKVILKYSYFGTSKHLELKTDTSPLREYNWEKAANLLPGHKLIKWVNQKCQLDVSEIILERLKHFILNVCPQLVNYIKEFTEFYKKDKIDLLFTPTVSFLEEYGALTAAKHYPPIKTACLVHGDGVYDSRAWNITELEDYNIHISSNNETKEYFQHLAKEIHSPAKLYSNPHRLRNVRKIACLRKNRGPKTIKKNRIIYVPLFFQWDARRMEGDPTTDTWYYKFQKSLIEYFSTRKDYTFVWKGLPQIEFVYNPIPDFINDNHFSNIEIATNPLVEHLLTADRVICDSPSTGFYESIIVGVPVMSLYHTSTIMRPGVGAYFGNLLKLFSDVPDVIKHIDVFLNSEREQYKMKIDMEEGSLFDILEGID